MQKKNRIALLAFAALALPAAAAAQQTPPAPATPAPAQQPAAASPQAEIAQIQQRLAQLQQQAAQDSAVKAAEAQFSADVMAAMQQLDATTSTKVARAEALQAEVAAAQAASDNAKLNALAAEAQELQAFFNGLRQRAVATPEIQEKRKAYLAVVLARMNEIDPQAQAMVDRLTALRSGGAAQR